MNGDSYDKFLSDVAELVPDAEAEHRRDLVLADDVVGHTRTVLIVRAAERIFHNAGDLPAAATVQDLYERCTAGARVTLSIVV